MLRIIKNIVFATLGIATTLLSILVDAGIDIFIVSVLITLLALVSLIMNIYEEVKNE